MKLACTLTCWSHSRFIFVFMVISKLSASSHEMQYQFVAWNKEDKIIQINNYSAFRLASLQINHTEASDELVLDSLRMHNIFQNWFLLSRVLENNLRKPKLYSSTCAMSLKQRPETHLFTSTIINIIFIIDLKTHLTSYHKSATWNRFDLFTLKITPYIWFICKIIIILATRGLFSWQYIRKSCV